MSKLWLVFIAGPNSYADIQEMVEPIRDLFAGLVVTYHGLPEDAEAKYLESVKGEGRIIYQPYCGRHFHSRNTYLWCGPIEQGDWCVQTDHLEHPNRDFIQTYVIPLAARSLQDEQVNCYYYYGKPFLIQYHESMRYEWTPHERLVRDDRCLRSMELNGQWPDESKVRQNVRPLKRDRWHFVKHYARYSLLPWGSNHYQLPLSGNTNAEELFRQRETGRLQFIALLRELGVKRDVDSVIAYMKGDMDGRFIKHIQVDKIWNDVYRRYVLDREDFTDNHDWGDLVEIKKSY